MTETNVFELTQPGTFSDPLTEVLRNGARTLLGQAVEAEVAAWLSTHTDKLTDDGRRQPGRGDCLARARHHVWQVKQGHSRCGARGKPALPGRRHPRRPFSPLPTGLLPDYSMSTV